MFKFLQKFDKIRGLLEAERVPYFPHGTAHILTLFQPYQIMEISLTTIAAMEKLPRNLFDK